MIAVLSLLAPYLFGSFSTEAVFLAERSRQHREMRLKSSAELRDKVEEFKSKLQHEKETMQKEFEDKVRRRRW